MGMSVINLFIGFCHIVFTVNSSHPEPRQPVRPLGVGDLRRVSRPAGSQKERVDIRFPEEFDLPLR